MKLCCKCKIEKEASEFYANKRMKDGLNSFCILCHKADNIARKTKNRKDPEFRAAEAIKKKAYRSKPEVKIKNKEYMSAWYANNAEEQRAKCKRYAEENKEYFTNYRRVNRARINAKTRKRQAAMLQRTPAWLDDVDYFEMECIYTYCGALRAVGLKYEVDHYYPLQGKEVSGLHAPSNLRVMQQFDNRSKSNKIEVI